MKKSRWSRGTMVFQMVSLLRALRGTRWWTLAELAEESNCEVWSVRRHIKAFEDANLPFDYEPVVGSASRYRLGPDWARRFLKRPRMSRWGRGEAIRRIVVLLRSLGGGRWWTLPELSEASDSPVWSARRDIKAFEEAGVPVECSVGEVRPSIGGRYRISAEWTEKFLGGHDDGPAGETKTTKPRRRRTPKKRKKTKRNNVKTKGKGENDAVL